MDNFNVPPTRPHEMGESPYETTQNDNDMPSQANQAEVRETYPGYTVGIKAEADTVVVQSPLKPRPQKKTDPVAVADSLLRLPYPEEVKPPKTTSPEQALFRPELMYAEPAPGVVGDLRPYRFRNDDYVTGALVISFLLAIVVVARSWHFLRTSLGGFFRPSPAKGSTSSKTDNEMRGQFFLILETCAVMGILFFGYFQETMPSSVESGSPYVVLSLCVGCCAIYYLLKWTLYGIVNSIFFSRAQCRQWSSTFLLSILTTGTLCFPLTLLAVYYDLNPQAQSVAFASIIAFVKIMLAYKCFLTFFNYRWGYVHLILYLCALEVVPALLMWRGLIWANIDLTSFY